ncbi:CYTH domain-containing protein [Candidatus Uhrbacteria bacterium]|nr:CYTH domain-containing protein [Candidatus Uhrbacteria bacterium]
MKKEVEILCRLGGTKRTALRKLSALEPVGTKRTVDTYYFDPKRPALRPKKGRLTECFRLRRQGDGCRLAYKVDHFRRGEWMYSDEHETAVAEADVMEAIVCRLGLKPLVVVDMVKHLFRSPEYEVAVEEVRSLGLFIEVESRRAVTEGEVAAERRRIRAFLSGLGLAVGEEMNSGKPELLLAQKPGKG